MERVHDVGAGEHCSSKATRSIGRPTTHCDHLGREHKPGSRPPKQVEVGLANQRATCWVLGLQVLGCRPDSIRERRPELVELRVRRLDRDLSHNHVAELVWSTDIDQLIYSDPEGYLGAVAAANAERMLMRGFTTVRDMGGPSFGLKKAIDEGIVPGPRIILKKIEAPDRQEFLALARKVRSQARKAGVKRSDLKKAVRASRRRG
jgi:hypothetical protein